MKRSMIACLLCLLSFHVIGCDKVKTVFGGDVALVKHGILEFDKSLTIGQAFDNYKYFKNTKWELITTNNGKKVVQVTGSFDASANGSYFQNVFVKYQFQINQDKTFELLWCGYGAHKNDGSKIEPLQTADLSMCLEELKFIYNNKDDYRYSHYNISLNSPAIQEPETPETPQKPEPVRPVIPPIPPIPPMPPMPVK